MVRALSANGPILIGVDDVQWLDASSARVLAFVLRRLEDEAVGTLASLRLAAAEGGDRIDIERAMGFDRVDRVSVGPMPVGSLGRMLREHVGVELSRPVIIRVHESSHGTPLFALEIAREIARAGAPLDPGAQLPVPDDLRQLLVTRIAALPPSTRGPLLVIAAVPHPSMDLIRATSDSDETAKASLKRRLRASSIAPTVGCASPIRSWRRRSTGSPLQTSAGPCTVASPSRWPIPRSKRGTPRSRRPERTPGWRRCSIERPDTRARGAHRMRPPNWRNSRWS